MPPREPNDTRPVPGLFELFCGFLSLGLLGFGGIAPWARHIIVERPGNWLLRADTRSPSARTAAAGLLNTVNAAILIGRRFHGAIGSAVAVTALLLMPVFLVVVLASLYGRFAGIPEVVPPSRRAPRPQPDW